MYTLLAIAALVLLVLVHEAGHMIVARLCGMRVEKFSIFFGPPLIRWRRGDTTYQIATIPLGGYVQIAGMNPEENLPPDDPGSYQNRPAWARFLTIFAGPATNYLFAMLIVVVAFTIWGAARPDPVVGPVRPGSPAAAAGLRTGDELEAVDGKPVARVPELVEAIRAAGGREVTLKVLRAGRPVTLRVTPRRDPDGVYRIGIGFKVTYEKVGVGKALRGALIYPVVTTAAILAGLKQWVQSRLSLDQVSGPARIVYTLKESFSGDLATAISFMAMLSIYLGLFNLFPLPALDGGRLIFLLYTLILRRPVNQRFEQAVHAVGFLLLMGLLILVTYNDIMRFLTAK